MDEYISREETAKAFCEKCRGYYDGHCIHNGYMAAVDYFIKHELDRIEPKEK